MINRCVPGTVDHTALSLFRLLNSVVPAVLLYMYILTYFSEVSLNMQIIDSFSDSVMSVCLTKTEIIGGSVDGTVRTFDIRVGRYVKLY